MHEPARARWGNVSTNGAYTKTGRSTKLVHNQTGLAIKGMCLFGSVDGR